MASGVVLCIEKGFWRPKCHKPFQERHAEHHKPCCNVSSLDSETVTTGVTPDNMHERPLFQNCTLGLGLQSRPSPGKHASSNSLSLSTSVILTTRCQVHSITELPRNDMPKKKESHTHTHLASLLSVGALLVFHPSARHQGAAPCASNSCPHFVT